MDLEVTIPFYEEVEDDSGQLYTLYHINVEEKVRSKRWGVRKRYR